MNYIKGIMNTIKMNRVVLYKLVPSLVLVFSLSYLPHMALVYLIRVATIGFALMSCGTLIYVGIEDVKFKNNKKKRINK